MTAAMAYSSTRSTFNGRIIHKLTVRQAPRMPAGNCQQLFPVMHDQCLQNNANSTQLVKKKALKLPSNSLELVEA
jgi:hypothetical protein